MTQVSTPEPGKSQKPWYKKWWAIALIAFVVIGLIGSLADMLASPVAVPDTIGKPVAEAEVALKDAGFKIIKINTPDGKPLGVAKDGFEITASDPAAGTEVKPSETVTLTASDERAQAEKKAAEEAEKKAAEEQMKTELSPSVAQAFCERYAKQLTDEKLRMHWIAGKLAEEQREDGTIFFKVKATGKNAAGAKHEYEIECLVGGTTEHPEMLEFNSY